MTILFYIILPTILAIVIDQILKQENRENQQILAKISQNYQRISNFLGRNVYIVLVFVGAARLIQLYINNNYSCNFITIQSLLFFIINFLSFFLILLGIVLFVCILYNYYDK